MKKFILFFFFSFFLLNHLVAQQNKSILKNVAAPDSIRKELVAVFGTEYSLSDSYKGILIYNLQTPKKYELTNGIYSFKLLGPHFPKHIFIFNNGKIFIFKRTGAFEPVGILEEYLRCIKQLSLSDEEIRTYLTVVSKYIKEEEGQTYGNESKN